MIVLIDNYDSFTYNLYQLLGEYEKEIVVVRNDQITIEQLEEMKPKGIVLSPGPGKPEDAGICIDVIRHFYKNVPILGICLTIKQSYPHLEEKLLEQSALNTEKHRV